WCFVLARTEAGSRRGGGLSYLLVPMDQPGITVRPIRQMTGTAEFNEVFFDDARTAAVNVVGAPGDGWRIAKATLAIERGAAMLGQQVGFRRDFEDLAEAARRSGASRDPLIRDRLARAWIGLRLIREYALDTLGTGDPARAAISSPHQRRVAATRDELAAAHGDRISSQPCDVTNEAQVTALIEGAAGRFGRIDVMINNAGLGGTASVLDMTDEQWSRVLDVTLNGTFRCTRAALRQMVAQGHGGAVVNNAWVLGWRAQPGQAHFAAAKAGVMALTRCA